MIENDKLQEFKADILKCDGVRKLFGENKLDKKNTLLSVQKMIQLHEQPLFRLVFRNIAFLTKWQDILRMMKYNATFVKGGAVVATTKDTTYVLGRAHHRQEGGVIIALDYATIEAREALVIARDGVILRAELCSIYHEPTATVNADLSSRVVEIRTF